jgi:hypothetical protein
MATPNYDIGSVLSLKRNGGLERKKRKGKEVEWRKVWSEWRVDRREAKRR